MIVVLRPAFLLALLAVVLCISFAEAVPGGPRTSPTPCSTSVPPSSCTPTAVQTKPATLTFPQYPSGPLGEGTDLVFGTDWLFVACSVYYDNSYSGPYYDSKYYNKGLCGTSTTTNLLIGYPSSNPPDFSITPRSPATAFTIFTLTFTASDFGVYPSITVEITGTPSTPYSSPVVKTVIILKPVYGHYYSSATANLVSLGLGDVAKLNFRAFYTGSTAPGGGPVYAEVRVDGDGNGGGINFEAYTPLGCEKYHKRDDISISPMVVMRRTLEGNEFAL